MPATALGNVFVALLAHFWLHEQISWMRWTGVLLITIGVAFVAHGPANTTPAVNVGDALSAVALHGDDAIGTSVKLERTP